MKNEMRGHKSRVGLVLLVGITGMIVTACAPDPRFAGVSGIREAEEAEVAACAYVANFRIIPGVYGPLLAEEGVRQARNALMLDAKTAGANTVVFDKVAPGTPVYELRATAYTC